MLLERESEREREGRRLTEVKGGRVREAEGGRDGQKRDEDLLHLTDSLG